MLTADRYSAIVDPLKKLHGDLRNSFVWITIAVWLLSIPCATPPHKSYCVQKRDLVRSVLPALGYLDRATHGDRQNFNVLLLDDGAPSDPNLPDEVQGHLQQMEARCKKAKTR